MYFVRQKPIPHQMAMVVRALAAWSPDLPRSSSVKPLVRMSGENRGEDLVGFLMQRGTSFSWPSESTEWGAKISRELPLSSGRLAEKNEE